jgi:hypothetical protein
MSVVRTLSWSLAALFVASTLLALAGDQLNLFAQPPAIPESANLVERVLAGVDYRHDLWPFFFTWHFLAALGFMAMSGLGLALMAAVPESDERRSVLGSSLLVGGALGAAGELVVIGAIKARIDIPYCDCGFKEQEVVSQVWALMITETAGDWLLNGAIILAAVGMALAGALLRRRLGDGWTWLSFATAALLLLALIVNVAEISEALGMTLEAVLPGVLIPIWAIWLGLRLPSPRQSTA